jgi:hypothetical protein
VAQGKKVRPTKLVQICLAATRNLKTNSSGVKGQVKASRFASDLKVRPPVAERKAGAIARVDFP